MNENFPVVISSEHSSNRIPERWEKLFSQEPEVLATHRGWDPGVDCLERTFGKVFSQPIIKGEYSRLLIELNRSQHHPRLFSEFSKGLSAEARGNIMQEIYLPYRDQVRKAIERVIDRFGFALHFSLHTFSPIWDDVPRKVDVGFLYDPKRYAEKNLVSQWIQLLRRQKTGLRLRRNQPYLGKSDGLTKVMRQEFQAYVGIELELNQAIAIDSKKATKVGTMLAETAALVAKCRF